MNIIYVGLLAIIAVLLVALIVIILTTRKETSRQISNLGMSSNQNLNYLRSTMDEQIKQVAVSMGEMKNLTQGVSDLQKILSNVKTRGILGEVQLGSILDQVLSPEQFCENINTRPMSRERVEFAVRLPGGEEPVYLPIDSKFPADAYLNLVEAYEMEDKDMILEASAKLDSAIKKAAKDISEKYIEPPYTTNFAIMFLPFEGLYAEVVRRGLIEKLQRDYSICIAGPTNMAALLNTIQMGFRTIAIKNNTTKVFETISAIKTEFEKFEQVLLLTQNRMEMTSKELDKLVGVRTRSIIKALDKVSSLEDESSRTKTYQERDF